MSLQFLADGLMMGAMIGLGAIGVTLTYAILRFANFAHGELIAWGTYLALLISASVGTLAGRDVVPIASLSFGLTVIAAALIAMVMASFGASMALRSLLEFIFSSSPGYFSRDIQIAIPVGFGIRATPDQLFLIALTAVLMIVVHLMMTRTAIGRAMRAVAENPVLARVSGIDVEHVIRATWIIAGALACASGVVLGITVQIRPFMGFDLLLPLFAAAILGGIGSVPGAVMGGLIVGISESASVQFIGAELRAAVAFLILIAVLLLRPTGLFGLSE